jgi:FKBP-type peptidyl-prolyl cis-trans isomerase
MNRLRVRISFVAAMLCAVAMAGCLEGYEPKTEEQVLQDYLKSIDKTKLAADVAAIDDSLSKWSLVAQVEPNGVRYIVHELGTGPQPNLRSWITFDYSGKFLTTKAIFDEGQDAQSYLSGLIAGWQTTLPLLPAGTKATLYIPSGLAYGAVGAKDPATGAVIVPPNSNIIFDIELKDVQ